MSLFGSVIDKVTQTAGTLGTAIKKVAKRVKRTAVDVFSGIAGKEGIVSKAYSKVKSLGTMALDKIFPRQDSSFIEPLRAVTSSSQQVGGTGFVNTFSQAITSAGTQSEKTIGSITDWFTEGLSFVGGKAKDGASYIYDSTMEFLGLKDPAKVKQPGDWVTTTAKKKAQVAPVASDYLVRDEAYNIADTRGITDLVGKPSYPLSKTNQPLNIQYDAAKKAGNISKEALETAERLGVSPYPSVVQTIADKGIVGSGMKVDAMEVAGLEKMMKPAAKTPTLLDKISSGFMEYGPAILEGFAGGLSAFGGAPEAPEYSRPVTPSQTNSGRGGIGGQGSAGGQFLTDAQRNFLEQQRRNIEKLG